jgi:hypothetical protein
MAPNDDHHHDSHRTGKGWTTPNRQRTWYDLRDKPSRKNEIYLDYTVRPSTGKDREERKIYLALSDTLI